MVKDLSSVPWAQMPVYGSPRAQSSLTTQESNLIDGITPEDTDEDTAPEATDVESDEQPEEANTNEGP